MKYTVTLAHKVDEAGNETRVTGTIEVAENYDAFEAAAEYARTRSFEDDVDYLVVALERGED